MYVEIKGFMDQRSACKIDSFRKNYPEKKLVVISYEEEIREDFISGLDR